MGGFGGRDCCGRVTTEVEDEDEGMLLPLLLALAFFCLLLVLVCFFCFFLDVGDDAKWTCSGGALSGGDGSRGGIEAGTLLEERRAAADGVGVCMTVMLRLLNESAMSMSMMLEDVLTPRFAVSKVKEPSMSMVAFGTVTLLLLCCAAAVT